jgi:peptidoglycan/LPS O-acetylase OafA/YrhL
MAAALRATGIAMSGAVQNPSLLPSGAIPSLDGVRAVAVTLVFAAHSGLEKIVPGGLGVTIFFVLSGYLISTLMRIDYAAERRVDYRAFYLRRFLRLMPPLVIVVLLTVIAALFSIVDPFTPGGLFSVLFYYGNYFVIAHDFQGVPAGVSVVWSLAVEEHYYLFYPPLAALLLRTGRVGTSAGTLGLLCLAVLGWRCWLATHGASENYLTMATDTRIDAILVGCLMALWCNPWLDARPHENPVRDAALIALSFAALIFSLLYRDEFFRMTFRYVLQSCAVAVLLYFAVAHAKAWPFRWLNARPLVYIGAISYTVYLSHHIIIEALARHYPELNEIVAALVAVLLTLAVAEPMRRFVEQPCAKIRKRLHKRLRRVDESVSAVPQAAPGSSL